MNSYLICNTRVYRPGLALTQRPRAFEIRNGRVGRVFHEPYPNSELESIDLDGAYVYPGFFDSHTHFVLGGSSLGLLNFSDVTTQDEILQRLSMVRDEMRVNPGRGWMIGLGFNQNEFQLTRDELDVVCGEFPVMIETKDLHSAIANRAALERASFWNPCTDPAGGRIERDSNGEPTGWLREFAVHAMKRNVPEETVADRRRWFEAACRHAHSLGVIGVGENATCELAGDYLRWADADALPLRIDLWMNEGWPNDETIQFDKWMSERLRIKTQKLFLDGSLGSRTAWFRAPYSDKADTCGFPLHSDEELYNCMKRCLEQDWELAIHNIGDASCEQLIKTAERLSGEGFRTSGIIAEHLQVCVPDAPQRMKRLGMTASMQPIHLAGDRVWMESRIGSDRCRHAFVWKTLLDLGITVRFGTDWPVEKLDPVPSLRTAILRTGYSGNLGESWYPDECIDFDSAFAAYSRTPHHRAGWLETGNMLSGEWADFIVLDTDLATTDPREWSDNPVQQTWLNGERVYAKSELRKSMN